MKVIVNCKVRNIEMSALENIHRKRMRLYSLVVLLCNLFEFKC